mmetsp:Transcript_105468/g.193459  ORF Transcript_105468/g.193459 Transcript_105468/m.193459 type:complete len:215 (-) Transcript_105468:612-1256(-)
MNKLAPRQPCNATCSASNSLITDVENKWMCTAAASFRPLRRKWFEIRMQSHIEKQFDTNSKTALMAAKLTAMPKSSTISMYLRRAMKLLVSAMKNTAKADANGSRILQNTHRAATPKVRIARSQATTTKCGGRPILSMTDVKFTRTVFRANIAENPRPKQNLGHRLTIFMACDLARIVPFIQHDLAMTTKHNENEINGSSSKGSESRSRIAAST